MTGVWALVHMRPLAEDAAQDFWAADYAHTGEAGAEARPPDGSSNI
jgi:hypothetical protein